jgi:DDE_Tnp_1-associated
MNYQVSKFTGKFSDPRRKQGQRFSLDSLLIIILMGILSGYQSLKGLARFAKSNEAELTDTLSLKHGVPKFNTLRDLLQHLDANVLANSFIEWVRQYHAEWNDEFIALDGKAIKSTVEGGNTSFQNFVAVVSAFGHTSGMVYGMKSYENGKSAETQCLRDLVEKLGWIDKTFTMDALHTKKKL